MAHLFDPFGIAQGLQQAQDKWCKVNGLKSILQAAEFEMRKAEVGKPRFATKKRNNNRDSSS